MRLSRRDRRSRTAVSQTTAHSLALFVATTERDAARAEAAAERRGRQQAEARAAVLARRLDELTAANQSYDVGP